jgi:DNA polymerase
MSKQILLDQLGGKGKDMIMSNEKFAKLLRKRGVDVPMKTSATTGKETYAFAKTDLDFLALQDHHDPVVQTLVAVRLGLKSTLEETRTSNLIAASKRGPLPIMLNYYGAHTGRFSGGDKLNLQNLPSRGDNTIRRALRAPKGHKIISCDSSQIEARMVAYIAGQTDLVQQFREGRDVYSEFASDIYHRKISKSDKVERFVGKTCILGLGYMTGSPKLRDTLKRGQGDISVDVTEAEAKEIVDIYRRKNHKIVSLWGACGYALSSMVAGRSGRIGELLTYNSSGILLPNGMTLQYHGLQAKGHQFLYVQDRRMFTRAMKARLGGDQSSVGEDLVPGQSRLYGGKVTENLVQALARIVVSGQMLKIKEAGYHVAFQVHDENVCVVPDAQAEQAQKDIEEIMSTPPSWAPDLPVACEAGMADTYGDA